MAWHALCCCAERLCRLPAQAWATRRSDAKSPPDDKIAATLVSRPGTLAGSSFPAPRGQRDCRSAGPTAFGSSHISCQASCSFPLNGRRQRRKQKLTVLQGRCGAGCGWSITRYVSPARLGTWTVKPQARARSMFGSRRPKNALSGHCCHGKLQHQAFANRFASTNISIK